MLLLDDLITEPSPATNITNIARMFADRTGPRDTMAVLPLNGGAATTSASRWFDAPRGAARANVSVSMVDPFGLTGGQYDGARTSAGRATNRLGRPHHIRRPIRSMSP